MANVTSSGKQVQQPLGLGFDLVLGSGLRSRLEFRVNSPPPAVKVRVRVSVRVRYNAEIRVFRLTASTV